MAIILKIDKPKSCAECILTYAKVCPLTNNSVVKNIINNTLSKDCPLRSADEMIAEIKGYCDEFGWHDGDLSDLSDDFLSIIHKYCGEKENDQKISR